MAKMGRPKISIDINLLEDLMKLSPSIQETADFFHCSHDVIERFIKQQFQDTFASFRDKRAIHTRMSIKRKMIEKALAGDNTMLIWLSKNMLGMADKVEQVTKLDIQDEKKSDENNFAKYEEAINVKAEGRAKELAKALVGNI